MRLSSKIVGMGLFMLVLQPALFGIDHIFTARIGGAVDRNVGSLGNSQEYHYRSDINGNFNMGLVYDIFPAFIFSVSPELHFNLNRNIHATLENRSFDAKWQELSLGLQVKFNIFGILYAGVGGGAGFAFKAKTNQDTFETKSSTYPYFVMELGGNVPIAETPNGTLIAVHLALRGSSNISVWQKQPQSGYFQNDFSIGFFTGISFLSLPSIM